MFFGIFEKKIFIKICFHGKKKNTPISHLNHIRVSVALVKVWKQRQFFTKMAKEKQTFGTFTLHYILIRLLNSYSLFSVPAPGDREPGAWPRTGAGGTPGGCQEARWRQGGPAGAGSRAAGRAEGLPAAPHATCSAQGQAGGGQGCPPVLQGPSRWACTNESEQN